MLPRLERVHRHLRVETAGHADVHHIHVGPVKQTPIIQVLVRPMLGREPAGAALADIGHRGQPGAGQFGDGLSVPRRHSSAADQSETE